MTVLIFIWCSVSCIWILCVYCTLFFYLSLVTLTFSVPFLYKTSNVSLVLHLSLMTKWDIITCFVSFIGVIYVIIVINHHVLRVDDIIWVFIVSQDVVIRQIFHQLSTSSLIITYDVSVYHQLVIFLFHFSCMFFILQCYPIRHLLLHIWCHLEFTMLCLHNVSCVLESIGEICKPFFLSLFNDK